MRRSKWRRGRKVRGCSTTVTGRTTRPALCSWPPAVWRRRPQTLRRVLQTPSCSPPHPRWRGRRVGASAREMSDVGRIVAKSARGVLVRYFRFKTSCCTSCTSGQLQLARDHPPQPPLSTRHRSANPHTRRTHNYAQSQTLYCGTVEHQTLPLLPFNSPLARARRTSSPP